MINGMLKVREHLIEIQTWTEQGGGVEDLVAWCHTCDHQGENVMRVEMREVSDMSVAFTLLMVKVSTHAL